MGLCRICTRHVKPSFSKRIFTDHGGKLICDIIMQFASVYIMEDDDLPDSICCECFEKLNVACEFRELIVKSDMELRHRVEEFKGHLKVDSRFFLDEPPKCEVSIEETADDEPEESDTEPFTEEPARNEINLETEDRKKRIYRCKHCEKVFRTLYSMRVHEATHLGYYKFECDVCKRGFPTTETLKIHRRSHFDDRPFKCTTCDKSFKTSSSLINHKRTHNRLQMFQCNICGKTLSSKESLRCHTLVHERVKTHVCEFCGKNFSSKRSVLYHAKVHTGEDPITETCTVCGKVYIGPGSLRKHMVTHLENRPLFKCEICDKGFKNKPSVATHMRIHNGEKPFACEICGKKFTQASCIYRHMRIHTGVTPYACEKCDHKFAYSHHLQNHLKRLHAEDNAVS